jgi:CheY-like chemotaxis protein
VAHDFNNILAVIQLQASLIGEEEYLSVEQKNSLDEIVDAARRAANLTRQLLLFSRREKIQPRNLDLSESISSVAKMLRRVLGEHIQMHFKFAPQPLLLHADPGMIDQILMNLAVNSRDAMPNGGTLIVETSAVEVDELAVAQSAKARPGFFVCLRVSDTGCGIAPEILERIFEPFFTTKEVGKGTGLGLATVFGIVAQHHGWIDVFSEIARGTTFRIYFPRLIGTVAHPEIGPASTGSFRGNGETILVLEDDASLRNAFKKALLQLGYRVLEAARGAEALESWQQHREDICLLLADLVIPGGMNGMECAQRLLQAAPNLKIVYMSGYSEDISPADLRIGPGIRFLAKPFDSAALGQTVRSALDAH